MLSSWPDHGELADWYSQAARRGFKFGWIHAIAHEQPPTSLYDLIQQRRRWYIGIMAMDSWAVKVALAIPMLGPLTHVSLYVVMISSHLVFLLTPM